MAQIFWSYSRRVFEAVLRKYSFEDATKKTAKRSSQIDGLFYAGCLSKKIRERWEIDPPEYVVQFPTKKRKLL